MADDGPITPEERRALDAVCPGIATAVISSWNWGTRLGLGVTFTDGLRHGVKVLNFDPDARRRLLMTGAHKLAVWHREHRADA